MSSTKSISKRISNLSLILYYRKTRYIRCSLSRAPVPSQLRSKPPVVQENSSKKSNSCSFPNLQSKTLLVTCHLERFQSHSNSWDHSSQQHFQMESVFAQRKYQEPLQMLVCMSEVVQDTIHQSPLELHILPKGWLWEVPALWLRPSNIKTLRTLVLSGMLSQTENTLASTFNATKKIPAEPFRS